MLAAETGRNIDIIQHCKFVSVLRTITIDTCIYLIQQSVKGGGINRVFTSVNCQ